MFFFFKQKTAYEMRISDWSSDVCSSDLVPTVQRSGAVGIEQKNLIGGECLAAAPDGQRATPSIPTEGLTYHDAVDGDGAITPADALPWKGRDKIGRASSREGVCQYV